MRVLLVDDDPLTSFSLMRLFAIRGMQVVSESTAAAAEQTLGRQEFDAVVVDAQVEQGQGMRVLATARQADPRVALFLLSDVVPRGGQDGSDVYYIEKPWVGFFVVDIVRTRCGADVRKSAGPVSKVQDERPTVELRPIKLARRSMRDSAGP